MNCIEIKINGIRVKLDKVTQVATTQIEGVISVNTKKQFEFSFNDNNVLSILPPKDECPVPELTKEVKATITNTLKTYILGYNRITGIQLDIEDERNCPVGCELEND